MPAETKPRELHCDMHENCAAPVTHIGSKGYVYCAAHAVERRESGYERCRKLTPPELATLRAGKPIARY